MAKTCTKCSLFKTLDNFRCHKSKRHLSGYAYHSWCKNCEGEYRISKITHQRKLENNPKYRLQRILNTKRYKALKRGLNETLTINEWHSILEAFGNRCFKCKDKRVTIDHYRPLSKGNPLTSDNAIPLCRSCNSSKGAKNLEEFFTKKINLIETILERTN